MISAVLPKINSVCFRAKTQEKEPTNPISKGGEKALALKATVGAGLLAGARALLYMFEDGFVVTDLFDIGENFVKKNKQGNKPMKIIAAFALLCIGFIGAVAAIYTLYKTPNINYTGKVNAFVKGKDIDVYIKGNKVEKELYNQMNEKAKNATPEEKARLKEQYLKLKAAKNSVPDSVKN